MSQKAVLITGAGSGIGESTAIYFSERGYDVVLAGRNKDKLATVSERIRTQKTVLSVDLSKPQDAVFLAKEAIKIYPHLDCVVNNAAIYNYKSFLDQSDSDWSTMMETNLMGPARIIRTLIPHFKKRGGGSVINIASTAGLRPMANVSAYSTSKAALIHLTQSLALEFAADQIKFHVICPGIVDTPIHGQNIENIRTMGSIHPLGRIGLPLDVAQAAYYLAAESQWMTGTVLPVDGGLNMA